MVVEATNNSTVLGHTPDVERLIAAFSSTDDIGAIIRCHFEAERAVDAALLRLTSGRFDISSRTYQYLGPKLDLLELLGVPPERIAPLRSINTLRNKFAHDGLNVIEASREEQLRRNVVKICPTINDPNFRVMMKSVTPETGTLYRDCTTSQQYTVLTMCAVAGIAALPMP